MAEYIKNERNVLDKLHHPGVAQLHFTFQVKTPSAVNTQPATATSQAAWGLLSQQWQHNHLQHAGPWYSSMHLLHRALCMGCGSGKLKLVSAALHGRMVVLC